MLAKGLLTHVRKTCFFKPNMAGGATIDDSQLRQPDLMDAWLEAPAQADSIAAISNQREVLAADSDATG